MFRSWSLSLVLNRQDAPSLHLQLVQALTEAILSGRLPPGMVLPGSRELAAHLRVNRKTVVLALDELIAQGWLRTQPRRGTFVAESLPMPPVLTASPAAASGEAAYALQGGEEGEGASLLARVPDGAPDTRLIPFDVLGRAFRKALIHSARSNRLAYDDPRGSLPLREALAQMLRMERGLAVDADNLCLVRGSQMGIFIAARLLLAPGDCVVMEQLSYPPARQAFLSAGARILPLAMDEAGADPVALAALCLRERVRVVYLTPQHQYPTTVCLSAERRMAILALAARYGFAVIEDDYDHEFHFAHHPVMPMAAVDGLRHVFYIGSLSKVLAPGLRIGYIVAPAAVIRRCAGQVLQIDRQGNAVTELAVAALMANGELKRHVRRVTRIYAERRRRLLALLRSDRGLWDYTMPAGGLAIWLRLADGSPAARRLQQAEVGDLPCVTASQCAVVPGSTVSAGLRLGFGHLDEEEMQRCLDRLRTVLTG
ncbi:PLP-dependent aminotransferase family protein [Paludibacterium sp. B53371]|uniref:MocR-like pyridoxine biosynthesis transcription factor PdxR n=1 Tax=Paludibacterium sp. B53371 TaxID=2806263 RepID=UPI001C04AA29|nr:PLP-dependent aminotransferase family protein [Paludibacterium sp. B53371]